MNIVTQVANAMQGVLTESADVAALQTGFIKRQRKLTGSKFAQTLVFGWLDDPDATLDELSQTAYDLDVNISPQGLDKRFTQECSQFLHQVLREAIKVVIDTDPAAIPVLQRFNGVYLQDTSTIVLPDSLSEIWQGCGGSSSKNTSSSLKLQIRWELSKGGLMGPLLQPGREQDRNSGFQKESLPPGALWMVDLGYFSLKEYRSLDACGVYWLSKVKSQCDVYDDEGRLWNLVELLEARCQDTMDIHVLLGAKERLPCRLIAIRVPREVAEVRRGKLKAEARRKGRRVSKRALKLAAWTALCCNIPPELTRAFEANGSVGSPASSLADRVAIQALEGSR